MATLKELLARRAAKVDQAQAILDKAGPNLGADEQRQFDALMAAAEADKDEIRNYQRMEGALADTARLAPGRRAPPMDIPGDDVQYAVPRGNPALRGFTDAGAAYAGGQWLRARFLGNEGAAAWCRDHMELLFESRAASEAINTAGGFLVPDPLEKAIIDNRDTFGVFRREAEIMPMTSADLPVPVAAGGLTGYWIGEGEEIPESDLAWSQARLGAKKLAALTRISSEVAEDAVINLAARTAEEVGRAFAEKEDDAGWNGDGTSTYGRIQGVLPKLTIALGLKGAVVCPGAHDVIGEVDKTDLAAVMAACPEYALDGAKWFCSGAFYGTVIANILMAAGGVSAVDLAEGPRRSFLGYPVVTSPKMPASLTVDYSGLVVCLFGNLRRAAMLGDRRGVRIQVLGEKYATTDQIGIKGTERVDINVHDVGTVDAAGPIVALCGAA